MRYLVCLFIMLVSMVFLSGIAFSAEHPGEHPGMGTSSEHDGHEHPGESAEHPGEEAMLSAGQIIKGIKTHINNVAKANNGYFPLKDTKEGKDLKLRLIRVHEDKVSYLKKDDAYFACTDFVTDDGKTTYDIDFWMKKNDKGELEVYQTKIHKKDGTPRFTYKDDEIAPVE